MITIAPGTWLNHPDRGWGIITDVDSPSSIALVFYLDYPASTWDCFHEIESHLQPINQRGVGNHH